MTRHFITGLKYKQVITSKAFYESVLYYRVLENSVPDNRVIYTTCEITGHCITRCCIAGCLLPCWPAGWMAGGQTYYLFGGPVGRWTGGRVGGRKRAGRRSVRHVGWQMVGKLAD